MSTLQQHYILTPSHIREPYLFYLLTHPPESTIHLRRAPPELAPNKSKKSAVKGEKKKGGSKIVEPELVQPPPTIIFCARARSAAYLTYLLKSLGIRSTALHSRLTQRERLNSLSLFRSSVVPVLISTDVGSRGLDIEEVALVINWDVPSEPEEYTHRVGRTARMGKGGVAVSFVTERDEDKVLKIETRISPWPSYFFLFLGTKRFLTKVCSQTRDCRRWRFLRNKSSKNSMWYQRRNGLQTWLDSFPFFRSPTPLHKGPKIPTSPPSAFSTTYPSAASSAPWPLSV